MKEIKINPSGIKQAIDNLLNKNELLQDKIYKQEDEIERLNNIIKKYEKMSFVHEIDLQNRIDKAIEYIKSYMPNYDFDKTNLIKVLDILKGDDKND